MPICEAGSWVENMLGVDAFIPAEQSRAGWQRLCPLFPNPFSPLQRWLLGKSNATQTDGPLASLKGSAKPPHTPHFAVS